MQHGPQAHLARRAGGALIEVALLALGLRRLSGDGGPRLLFQGKAKFQLDITRQRVLTDGRTHQLSQARRLWRRFIAIAIYGVLMAAAGPALQQVALPEFRNVHPDMDFGAET